jgi:hypothetical protein
MAAVDAEGLRARMAAAAEAGDFETAARLRDELRALEAAAGAGSKLRRQAEGAMGLGTDVPVHARPKGWTAPKKPDLMTTGVRPRRGR